MSKFRMRLAVLAVPLALFCAITGPLAAQTTGTIQGEVREANTLRALSGIRVSVVGRNLTVTTSAEGRYTLPGVPPGQVQVQVSGPNYLTANQTVTVGAGQTSRVTFQLLQSAVSLDEIVVTGAGVATERRKLGNTIASISSNQLENKPIQSFSEVLQGREPGVVGLPSGGLTGEGTRIRIRGTKSLSQTNEPIVVLNGVRIDNGGGRGNIGTGGGGQPSRLDDIDPASIERVEILKGAAAATLYGSEAAAGVIQIFTKRGAAGAPRWELEVTQGMLRYPNVWEPNAGFVTTQADAQRLGEFFGMEIQPYQVFERNFITDLFETGYSSNYNGSVSGGSESVTYFAGGRYQFEDGPFGATDVGLANDRAWKAQGTANLLMTPRDNLQLRVGSLYTESRSNIFSNNNNIYAPFTLAIFGQPQRANCSASSPILGTGQCEGAGNPRGQAAFATVREALQRSITQEAQHFNGSFGTNYRPAEGVVLDVTTGVDLVTQRDALYYPFGYNIDQFTANNVEGSRTLSNRTAQQLTFDGKLSWDASLGQRWSFQTVVGAQSYLKRTEVSGGTGTQFPGPGFEVIEAGSVQDVDEFFESVVNAGVFVQEQIGLNDWIFTTLGARYDYSSAFGASAGGALYPKISLSVVPSDRPGWDSDLVSSLRLRAAIGQAGQQPAAFAKLTTFSSIRAESGAGIRPGNLGNPDLKPEISTEWEVGSEVGLFRDRASLQFTYWDRTVSDALVSRQFPVSGGFLARQLVNIGQIDSRGLEAGINAIAFQRSNFTFNVFVNAAYINEVVTDLGGAPTLKVGDSYPRYRNFVREGFAPGAFFGPRLVDAEFPIDTNNDCQADTREQLAAYLARPLTAVNVNTLRPVVVGGDPRPQCAGGDFLGQYLGKPTPDWAGAFGGTLTLFRNWEVSNLFEYKAGNFYVHNLTDGFRRAHPALGGNLRGGKEAEATLRNPASTPEQRVEAARTWVTQYAALTPYDGLNEVEKADFVRWREASITYRVPQPLTQRFGARSMALTLSGRNMALWTKYGGTDPETNLIGRTGASGGLVENFANGIDAFGLPLPRRISVSARVGF